MINFLEVQAKENITLTDDQPILLLEQWSKQAILSERSFTVAPGAEVSYLMIVNQASDLEIINRSWSIGKDAKVNLYYLFLQPLKAEIKLNHDIAEGAQLISNSLILGKGDDFWKLAADYNFQGPNNFGRVKIDANLQDESHLSYDANINVLPLAQKSDTRVDMRLYLDQTARGQLIPGLNIAANDVKAGHSASTFQLSAEDLFYLRSRGLSLLDIKKLLGLSLAKNFIQGLSDEKMRAEIITLIENNL